MTPRVALEAALSPLVAQLSDLDGRRYLRLVNQLASHPASAPRTAPGRRVGGEHAGVGPLLRGSLALQARLTDAEDPPIPPLDPPVFLEDLLDAVKASFAPDMADSASLRTVCRDYDDITPSLWSQKSHEPQ